MATSGPGATKPRTAIADAYMEFRPDGRRLPASVRPSDDRQRRFFRKPIFPGMTLPVVKHSYLITDINEIPRVVTDSLPHCADPDGPGRW